MILPLINQVSIIWANFQCTDGRIGKEASVKGMIFRQLGSVPKTFGDILELVIYRSLKFYEIVPSCTISLSNLVMDLTNTYSLSSTGFS